MDANTWVRYATMSETCVREALKLSQMDDIKGADIAVRAASVYAELAKVYK